MNTEELKLLAIKFRELIENVSVDKRLQKFENFPKGVCGDTTILLATYLYIVCNIEFNYMFAEFEKDKNELSTHAWLEKDDLIIDITADQFENINDQVIVSKNSRWHKELKGSSRGFIKVDTLELLSFLLDILENEIKNFDENSIDRLAKLIRSKKT